MEADFRRFYQIDLQAAMYEPGRSLSPRLIDSYVRALGSYEDSALRVKLLEEQKQPPKVENRSLDDIEREAPHLFVVDGGKN